jgi:hypothetical protein
MRYDYARSGISKSFPEHPTRVYNIRIQATDRDCGFPDYLVLCIQTQLYKRLPLVFSHIRIQPPIDVFLAAYLVLWLWLVGFRSSDMLHKDACRNPAFTVILKIWTCA